jgi:hypothetical protein
VQADVSRQSIWSKATAVSNKLELTELSQHSLKSKRTLWVALTLGNLAAPNYQLLIGQRAAGVQGLMRTKAPQTTGHSSCV